MEANHHLMYILVCFYDFQEEIRVHFGCFQPDLASNYSFWSRTIMKKTCFSLNMSISGVCCELFDAFKNGKISGFLLWKSSLSSSLSSWTIFTVHSFKFSNGRYVSTGANKNRAQEPNKHINYHNNTERVSIETGRMLANVKSVQVQSYSDW